MLATERVIFIESTSPLDCQGIRYPDNITVKLPSVAVEAAGNAHRAPEQWLTRLDPEWVQVWNAHGGRHRQAEEVPIEEVRQKPLAYSFAYPTWSGKNRYLSHVNWLLTLTRPFRVQGK